MEIKPNNVSHSSIENLKHSKFSTVIASFISYVFHPVFMPVINTLVLYALTKSNFAGFNTNHLYQLLFTTFLNTVLFPLFATFLMVKLGFVSSIKMPNSKDRIIPLMASMVFYFWIYQVFKNFGEYEQVGDQALFIYKIFFLGNFFAIIGVFLVNIFTKISMHTAAAGGSIGILLVLAIIGKVNIILVLIAALFFAGIIGTARIILKQHNPFQIWTGYIIGAVAMFIAYWLWR
jgi:membrane-associated phospholipid phosphatase